MKKILAVFAGLLMATSVVAQDVKPKIITLPSGIKVRMIQPGQGGELPALDSKVLVNYRGILENGSEFDSSYRRGTPTELQLNQVIQCWRETIPMMTPGAKIQIYCPSQTAYGPQAVAGVIPPNANLTFEVELVSIVK